MNTKRFALLASLPVALTLAVVGCSRDGQGMMNLPALSLRDPMQTTASLQLPDKIQAPAATEKNTRLAETENQVKTALVAAQLMAHSHYLNHPLDAEMSGKVFDEYLNTLDPRHLYFLESDIKEFEPLRSKIGEMMSKRGDVTPAFQMFSRLLERIDQENAYVADLLKNETFTFTGDETYPLDRKKAPHPADLDAAKKEWRSFLRYAYLQEKLNNHKPEEIVKTLNKRYQRQYKALKDYDSDDVFELYLNGLAHAYDPHSDYLGKSALDRFNIEMKLSVFGIGAMLQSEDGYAKIMELTPGAPAIKSGKLKPGDRIAAVAQGDKEPVDVVDLKIDKVVELIRGPKGTKVKLTIIPADAPDPSTRKVVELIRDEVKLEDSEAKAKVIDTTSNGKPIRLGIIDLPSFYADFEGRSGKSTTADVAKLVKKLEAEKVAGIVLDLRRNPGGSLQEVINMTGLFLKAGPVVQVKSSDGDIQVDSSKNTSVLYDGPLVVLTSRGSASASEILAGALQDYGRAVIVGDSATFGKGTVQTVAGLGEIMRRNNLKVSNDPGALKLTIQKFYRVSGSSTQFNGVVSDIVVPSLTNYFDIGEKTLDNPLPFDTIPAANYQKVNRIAPILPELKKRSEARINSDHDFAFVRKDIDLFKKQLAMKSVSLNEEQRRKEKAEGKARVEARAKELKARPVSKDKVYLVTLANLDQPALSLAPPPKPSVRVRNSDNPDSDETTGADTSPTPVVDVTLDEGEHILEDIITLSAKAGGKPSVAKGQ